MRHIRVKPSKPISVMGLAVGIIFVILGLVVIVPQFGLFGIFWTLVAGAIAVYHGVNVFSQRGAPLYQVDVDGGEQRETSPDVASRLQQLENLKRDGLVSDGEYEEQRARILKEL